MAEDFLLPSVQTSPCSVGAPWVRGRRGGIGRERRRGRRGVPGRRDHEDEGGMETARRKRRQTIHMLWLESRDSMNNNKYLSFEVQVQHGGIKGISQEISQQPFIQPMAGAEASTKCYSALCPGEPANGSAGIVGGRERSARMEGLTASEIAGFGVGALLLCATIAAPRVDGFIASAQRRSLSMCKRCGDLRMVACSQCKGVGSVRKGGIFTFGMLDNIYESLGAESKATNLVACTKCLSKGHLLCPECSKVS